MKALFPASYILFFLALTTAVLAFQSDPYQLTPLRSEIRFDGYVNEEAWDDIAPFPLVVHQPNFGARPNQETEIMVGYDDQFIYVGARLYDSDPDKILAMSRKRDALVANTDWLGIVIDSYNDKENALGFFTNPNGLRMDAAVFNDAIGEFPINVSWNSFWDVKTQITSEGWFVEMRIPFSSLTYQESQGNVTMGLIVWRWVARDYTSYIWPHIPPDWGDWSSWKPSMAEEVGFTNIRRKKPVYIAPYVLGGFGEKRELNNAETSYEYDRDLIREAGLDFKYGITKNLTLDLSLNTDFAQVEADDEQINLTRFSLFFPEKRLFFQERSGIFNFDFGPQDKLFHSRRIGIREEEAVGIYGGARLVGRVGNWDFGFLDMQTEEFITEDGEAFPSENYGVLRLRKRFINENSYFGGLLTTRMDLDGDYNATFGLDMNVKYGPSDYLSVRWAQTYEDGNQNRVLSADPSRFWISASNKSDRNFTYGISFSRSGKDFNPELGFQPRENFTRFGNRLGYGWYQDEESRLFKHVITFNQMLFLSNEYREIETYSTNMEWAFQWKSGFVLKVGGSYDFDRIYEAFDLTDDIEITPDEYNYWLASLGVMTSFAKPFYIGIDLKGGTLYDGKLYSASFSPTYNVSAGLELGGAYIFNRISFDNPDMSEILHLVRLKGLLMFSTKVSLSSFIQYNSTNSTLLANIRFRFNPSEGTDLYIVINEDLNTSRDIEQPRLPFSNQRSIQLKYTHTFRL